MAFNNNALTARLDELRSRNPPRVPSEGNTGQNTPFRYSGSYMTNNQQQQQPQPQSSGTETPSLQRRFTADMSKMPIAPIGELNQNTEPLEVPAIVSGSRPFYIRTKIITHLPLHHGIIITLLIIHLYFASFGLFNKFSGAAPIFAPHQGILFSKSVAYTVLSEHS